MLVLASAALSGLTDTDSLTDMVWHSIGLSFFGMLRSDEGDMQGGGRKFMGHSERRFMSQIPSESFKRGHM